MKNILFMIFVSTGILINNNNMNLHLNYSQYDLEVSSVKGNFDIHLYNIISIHVFFNYVIDEEVTEEVIIDLYTNRFNELPPGFVSPLILSTTLLSSEVVDDTLILNLSGNITENKSNLDLVSNTLKDNLGYQKVIYLQEGNDFYIK